MLSINILFLVLFILLVVVLTILYLHRRSETRFTVSIAVLENIIDTYCSVVFLKKVESLAKEHNLDPNSKINSIVKYNSEIKKLISISTVEIMKLITPEIRHILSLYYTKNALALIISNKLKKTLS